MPQLVNSKSNIGKKNISHIVKALMEGFCIFMVFAISTFVYDLQ
jgi:hypothetical protein